MRIIAGSWRARPLEAPPGHVTRPTADRVRETLFSMLASRLGPFEGLRVADLFAGSGALGLEALSRGAAFACFVENDPQAAAAAFELPAGVTPVVVVAIGVHDPDAALPQPLAERERAPRVRRDLHELVLQPTAAPVEALPLSA